MSSKGGRPVEVPEAFDTSHAISSSEQNRLTALQRWRGKKNANSRDDAGASSSARQTSRCTGVEAVYAGADCVVAPAMRSGAVEVVDQLQVPTSSPVVAAQKRHREVALLRCREKRSKVSSSRCNSLSTSMSVGAGVDHDSTVGNVSITPSNAVHFTGNSVDSEATSRSVSRPHAAANDGRHFLASVPAAAYTLPVRRDCRYCGAKKIVYETIKSCCSDGTIRLASPAIPNTLKDLLLSNTGEAKFFRTCIRTINNQFAFTSLGVMYDKELSQRNNGVYAFRIQGQMYHFLSDLESSNNLQLYFHDTENEVQNRLMACPRLTEDITHKVLEILEGNPYARFFRGLKKVHSLDDCHIVLRCVPGLDQRTHNQPSESQVAALWVDGGGSEEPCKRDIRVHCAGGICHRIQYYFGCYDPLQYPLMFPSDQVGWHQGIQKKIWVDNLPNSQDCRAVSSVSPWAAVDAEDVIQREEDAVAVVADDPNFVSLREYYAYKLQVRKDDGSCLLQFGRLFQQFIVDMYVKIESQRLDFYKSQQLEIRNEVMAGVQDCLSNGETEASMVGQRMYLPSGFIGGPRNIKRRYMDAMTLVQRFGRPDIFLTMTCNPNWPEIRSLLLPSEESQNRPDMIARIFRAKLENLKKEILKKHIFGEVAAYTYTIEFQKRGLPHAHLLLILKPQFKLYTANEYDRIVCAEIPDRVAAPHLHKMVVKHMLHGPCGIMNRLNPCMKKTGTCKNFYPKDFCDAKAHVSDAYPKYRRRDNNIRVKVRGHELDNRWVISYNPYLLAKFNCHMNVEVCSTIKAVKYIYKYICKGHDKIAFHVDSSSPFNEIDEIEQYRTARWVSPPEAAWRIFRFYMGDIRPSVIHLQVHLENYQHISFRKNDRLHRIVNNPQNRKTMLTEFFYMNANDPYAQSKNLTYLEFPEYFVWMSTEKRWKKRIQRDSVGRLVSVHISEGERFYLRLLLSKVRFPKSFDDLKYFNGRYAGTFREAALERGLLEEDNSQEMCLEEASRYQMPYEMRRLFSNLLIYACPNNPKKLWEQFEEDLCADFLKKSGCTSSQAKVKALAQLSGFLESMGRNISSFDLVPPNFNLAGEKNTREVDAERSIIVSQEDLNAVGLLNKEQKKAFDVIMNCIEEKKSGAFFVDGPGGTGKSFLYRALLATVRSRGCIALATATSGIAASIFPGGRTAHSRFKIPIDLTDIKSCRISKQSGLGFLIRESKLTVWDEAPMAKRDTIEALDLSLKDLCGSEELFGGKVIVFGGDFKQVLPVVRRGSRNETIDACLISSTVWPLLKKMKLTENMRARLDPMFTEMLLRIGNGEEPTVEEDLIKIPNVLAISCANSGGRLCRKKCFHT